MTTNKVQIFAYALEEITLEEGLKESFGWAFTPDELYRTLQEAGLMHPDDQETVDFMEDMGMEGTLEEFGSRYVMYSFMLPFGRPEQMNEWVFREIFE